MTEVPSIIGLDLAKSVFQVHGADAGGNPLLKKRLPRSKVLTFFANLPPALVGMEACGSAHYWARELQKLGHEVRLIPPQFVKPFVKTNKNDAADAEAIAEALMRPTMRFAAIKSEEQQATLMLHRARETLVRQKTQLINALRGHCAEFGIVVAQGAFRVNELIAIIADAGDTRIHHVARQALGHLVEQFHQTKANLKTLEAELKSIAKNCADCQRLETIRGVGYITATAMVATIGTGKQFKSGRELAAWLGLVPRQNSSGNKQGLGRISKRGDAYLRRLLVHGQRTATLRWRREDGSKQAAWVQSLMQRRPTNVVLVAMANKTARTIWALLTKKENYRLI